MTSEDATALFHLRCLWDSAYAISLTSGRDTNITTSSSLDATGTAAVKQLTITAGRNYVDDDTSSLTVFGGSGGNTFTVDGTINNIFLSPVTTSLSTGFGDDTTSVEATAAGGPLDVHGQAGQDAVIVSHG